MTFRRILIYLLTVPILTLVLAKRPFTISINEIACEAYAEPVAVFYCHLHTVNNRSLAGGHMIFSQNVTEFQVKVNVDLLSSAGTPMKLFDLVVDGCKMLATVDMSTMLKSVMTQLKREGHLPDRCPILANENYTVSRFVLDADMLPLYTPEFQYVMDIRLIMGPTVATKALIKGNVQSKKKVVYLRN